MSFKTTAICHLCGWPPPAWACGCARAWARSTDPSNGPVGLADLVPKCADAGVAVDCSFHSDPAGLVSVKHDAAVGHRRPSRHRRGCDTIWRSQGHVGPKRPDGPGKSPLFFVKVGAIPFPQGRVVTVGAPWLTRTPLGALREAPLAAARAILHEVGLAHHKGHLVLVDRAHVRQVEVGNCCAPLVRLVPVVETVGERPSRVRSIKQPCPLSCAAQHRITLDSAELMHVGDALVDGRRIQLEGLRQEARPCLLLYRNGVRHIRKVFEVTRRVIVGLRLVVVRGVVPEEEELRVVGLCPKDNGAVVNSACAQQRRRVLWKGHTVGGGPPRPSVGEAGYLERLERGHARLEIGSATAPDSLGDCSRVSDRIAQIGRPQATRLRNGGAEEVVRVGGHVLQLDQPTARRLPVDRHLGRVAPKSTNLTANPSQRRLNVEDSPVAGAAAGRRVLRERHPPDRPGAVVEIDRHGVVECRDSGHVVRLSLAELVAPAVDEDKDLLERATSRRCGLPHVGDEALLAAIRCVLGEHLEACRAPHGAVPRVARIWPREVLGRCPPLSSGKWNPEELVDHLTAC
mmetsp:Transcript_8221/g.20998  ORF Transcript_8221/g.20998 Transcript_8221/m.20998 type:complete len:572 (-) Transcript_8221:281-1996(-)